MEDRYAPFYTSTMALNIKSDEADRLARELAVTTGESLTDAVTTALEQRLQRERARQGPTLHDRLHRLQADVARLPVRDQRAPDAIIGYDGDGLPT